MTSEDAIKELKILKEEYWDDDGYGHETKQYDDTMFALDMAIKALEQQPCEDCISREAAIRWVKRECNPYGKPTLDFESGKRVLKYLEQMPPVTPKYTDEEIDRAQAVEQAYIDKMVELTIEKLKRPKGEWISKPLVYGVTYCSECNFELKINNTNYCPNCGAKMTESEE